MFILEGARISVGSGGCQNWSWVWRVPELYVMLCGSGGCQNIEWCSGGSVESVTLEWRDWSVSPGQCDNVEL